jgi:hypothetical protein
LLFLSLLSCKHTKNDTTSFDCCQLLPSERSIECSPEEINNCSENICYSKSPELQIGTGEYTWESLEENDPVMMVHGPQGGWHMLGSILVKNSNQIVEVSFKIFTENDVLISDNNYRVAMIMEEECQGYYPGMFGYLNVSPLENGELDTPPELLENANVRFEMTTNDCSQNMNDRGECSREGRWSQSSLEVSTQLDPQDIDFQSINP